MFRLLRVDWGTQIDFVFLVLARSLRESVFCRIGIGADAKAVHGMPGGFGTADGAGAEAGGTICDSKGWPHARSPKSMRVMKPKML
jgi:hypothetical protein